MAFINHEEAMLPDGKKGAGLFAYLRGLRGGNGAAARVSGRIVAYWPWFSSLQVGVEVKVPKQEEQARELIAPWASSFRTWIA